MKCINCNIDFEGRADAKFCSPKCRVTFSRKQSVVTDNVTFKEIDVTDNFEYYTITKANGLGRTEDEKSPKRTARYWYDIPLGAIPIIKKDHPKCPEWMNGREYFLWWKNEFEMDGEQPKILNPYPKGTGEVKYFQAGDNSRRWGA